MSTQEQRDELEELMSEAHDTLADLVARESRQHETARLLRFIRDELEPKAEQLCRLDDGTLLSNQRDRIVQCANKFHGAVTAVENNPDKIAAQVPALFNDIRAALEAVELEGSRLGVSSKPKKIASEGGAVASSATTFGIGDTKPADTIQTKPPAPLVSSFKELGCDTIGDVVVAHSEAAIQHFQLGKLELMKLLPHLRQADQQTRDDTSLHFRIAVAELSGIAEMLELMVLDLGLAVRSQSLLQTLKAHPEYGDAAGLALSVLNLILVAVA